MAGTIIADFIRADANKLSLNVGNTIIASVNSMGILSNTGNVMISSSGTFDANLAYYGSTSLLSSGKVRGSLQPAGSVLQVVQTVKSDTFSVSSTTFTDITGLSVSITPISTTSKILIMVTGHMGYYAYHGALRLLRDSTVVGKGDLAGSRPQSMVTVLTYTANSAEYYHIIPFASNFLDSPSTTSPITYKLQLASYTNTATYINRSYQWQNQSAYDATPITTITAMEIAQ